MLGAINGALVAGLGLPSIVVTLATMAATVDPPRNWHTRLRALMPVSEKSRRPLTCVNGGMSASITT